MKTNDIKKGAKIRSTQLGVPVSGVMLDSMRGNIRLIDTKGSEVGLFDEAGSVYAYDIVEAENAKGEWELVEHTKEQLELKQKINGIGL